MPMPDKTRRTRRRHPRADLAATAILFSDRRPMGPCLIEDLSAGGMRAVVGAPIRRGRVVSVLLDLPGKEPIMSFAQVARHEERRPGEHVLALSFLDLARPEHDRLQSVVAGVLAHFHPCLDFFDTDDDGRLKRLVLADDTPVIG
jgi:hypothetical protein